MKIIITKKDLVALHACPEGLAYFKTLAPRGVLSIVWDVATQIKFAVEARGWISWAVMKNVIPIFNLTHANLAHANLTDADLTRGAYLAYADLTRANLTRANLAYANLTGANLTDADLTRANLTGANLAYANLTGANLTGAYGTISVPGWVLVNSRYQRAT